jgi:ribokinase
MNKKIVVIGSSNIDLLMKMDRLPKVGETVTGATFMQVYGGKGANQAVAAARAGGDVSFINCVGDDAYTPQMLENFIAEGIDTQFVFKNNNLTSGHALIMIGSEGKNYLSVAPGANADLSPDKIKEANEVIEKAAIIVMQYEIPLKTIEYVLDLAQEYNIPVLWNFAPAQKLDIAYLKKTEILVVNETEASFITNMEVTNRETAEKAAQKLLELGSKLVILTLGADGVVYGTKNEMTHVPAFKVKAEDTTAAGDTFCGSFAVAHTEGKSLKEAILFSSAAAALAVTRMGAQPSIPNRKEIDSFLTI